RATEPDPLVILGVAQAGHVDAPPTIASRGVRISRFRALRALPRQTSDGLYTTSLSDLGGPRRALPAMRQGPPVPGVPHAAPEMRGGRARLLLRGCRRPGGGGRPPVRPGRGGGARPGGGG